MSEEEVARVALTDDAIEAIRAMIVSGELQPGDRLPREADLAGRLGLSRNSLREAVKALALINVLVVRQGDGTYVSSLDPTSLMATMGFVMDFQPPEAVLEFLAVRRMLEPAATADAATAMSDTDLGGLGTLLASLPKEPDVEELVANDLEFHARIAAATGNRVLCSLLDALSSRTQKVRVWRGLTQTDAVERTMREHHAIHRALVQRDAEAARAWATVHIAGVEEWLRASLPDRLDET
jgi:GntR family transcriptional repressor for pyruvate dehydrogenase complex